MWGMATRVIKSRGNSKRGAVTQIVEHRQVTQKVGL